MGKNVKVTQELCVRAKELADKKKKTKQVAKELGIAVSTLTVIKRSGYNLIQYDRIQEVANAKRRAKRAAERPITRQRLESDLRASRDHYEQKLRDMAENKDRIVELYRDRAIMLGRASGVYSSLFIVSVFLNIILSVVR